MTIVIPLKLLMYFFANAVTNLNIALSRDIEIEKCPRISNGNV